MNTEVRCADCNRILRNTKKGKLCSNCKRRSFWKEKYEQLKEETDKRFKLYDITIKSLMEEIRKFKPIEELDN